MKMSFIYLYVSNLDLDCHVTIVLSKNIPQNCVSIVIVNEKPWFVWSLDRQQWGLCLTSLEDYRDNSHLSVSAAWGLEELPHNPLSKNRRYLFKNYSSYWSLWITGQRKKYKTPAMDRQTFNCVLLCEDGMFRWLIHLLCKWQHWLEYHNK